MKAPTGQTLKSDLILQDLKQRQQAKQIIDVEVNRVKVVIFSCGDNQYAFYGVDIREILSTCDISWVPCLPDYLPGLINIRGDIESVIDIRHFLREGKNPSGSCMVAMAVRGDFHSGVLIDSIEDVVDIPVSAIHPPLSTLDGAARDLVCGETEFNGVTVSILDIGKLEALISI